MQHTLVSLNDASNEYGERADCHVRAYSVFAGISYSDSHDLHKSLGRKKCGGTNWNWVSQLINVIDHEGYSCYGHWLHFKHSVGLNVVGESREILGRDKVTVKTFQKLCQTHPELKGKRIIVFIRGHAIGINEHGEVLDWTVGRGHRVVGFFISKEKY